MFYQIMDAIYEILDDLVEEQCVWASKPSIKKENGKITIEIDYYTINDIFNDDVWTYTVEIDA